ncbi:MAG: hypothetical protein ABIG66_05310 [Candidatus Kerfeldbacteria bacterium]
MARVQKGKKVPNKKRTIPPTRVSSFAKKKEAPTTPATEAEAETAKKKQASPKKKVEFKSISSLPDVKETADINSIYDIDGEGPVDLTKLDQKQGRGKWYIIIAASILVLAAAAYIGYRVFDKDFGSPTMTGEVEFSVSVEDDMVASGDLVSIEVKYENHRNVDIIDAEVEVFYPEGFYYQSASAEPNSDNNRMFYIGDVRPGAGGTIRITGQMVGIQGEEKEISALLSYQPKNFSTDFQENDSTTVKITSSIVELSIDAPSQVQSGQEMTYSVEFTNTAKLPLNGIKIAMDYPDGFTYSSSSLDTFGTDNEWRVDVLNPGETQTLEIIGILDGTSGDTKEFHFQLGLIEIDNTFSVQMEQTSLVVVVNPEVELTLVIPEFVNPGDEVTISATIKNTSDAEIEDVTPELLFDGDLFMAEQYSFEVIKSLKPFESKERETTITLAGAIDGSIGSQEITLQIGSAVVEGNEVTFPNIETAVLKVRGGFSVTAEGRYFDENLKKIGDGPLPPVVNYETTYIVWWSIVGGANTVQNAKITTTLPKDVIWKKDASDDIEYDSKTRKVTYTKETIQANTETSVEFTISVAPTNDDLDRLLVLTGETVVSATDTVTGEEISMQLERITTDLPNDEGAKNKGVVEGKL